jgi:AraC-like DNA-binding protein
MIIKGTLASKEELLKWLNLTVNLPIDTVLFPSEEPLPDYPVFLEYSARLIVPLDNLTRITGAFDGEIKTKLFRAGQTIFTAKNCWATSQLYASKTSFSVVVMPDYVRFVAGKYENGVVLANPYYHTAAPPSQALNTLIQALSDTRSDLSLYRNDKACHIVKALLFQCVNEIQNDAPKVIAKGERSYRLVKEYIDHNYHFAINLNSICDELNFHPSHVSKMFRKYSGTTVSKYLENRRMKAAQELLSYSEAAIANIATQCGYSSEAYFIKVFKRYYGTTPGKQRISPM